MNNLFCIKDYVVVITGGTGILGRCIAKYLALEGAKVIIGGRKADVGKEIVDDITAAGGTAEFVKMDVMDAGTVQEACDHIVAKYGRVDTLLNAAAICRVPLSDRRRLSSTSPPSSSRAC